MKNQFDRDAGVFRHEYKYLVSAAQIPLLESRIRCVMKRDPHTGQTGRYRIRSLYFDSASDRCYYENEDGVDPREKFRLRIYNHSPERISLECKRKEHGMTQKTACRITRDQTERLIRGEPLKETPDQLPPLLRKLDLKRKTEQFHPVIIVEYDRIPYVYRDGNVRVTFDCNIASGSDPELFLAPEIHRRPVLPVGQHLMEVKYDAFLPDFIYQGLNLGVLNRTAFSKYYICRTFCC